MTCDSPECEDESPHDWGDDGCSQPDNHCGNCGAYFDAPESRVVQKATLSQEEVEVFFCPKCGAEEFAEMHYGFENGDKIVVLDGKRWEKGIYQDSHSLIQAYIQIEDVSALVFKHRIFSQTKSGWLKLQERFESQIDASQHQWVLADHEIKKIEEEEKKCQDQ